MSAQLRLPEVSTDDVEPRLPPEVEHIIFTMAFDPSSVQTGAVLSLVAKRVRAWIRPLIYRVIDQVSPVTIPDFSKEGCPPIEDIGTFVQHLILGRTQRQESEIQQIISQCPNIKSLACWYSFKIKPFSSSLVSAENLRALSGDLSNVQEHELYTPSFLRLTHLEILSDTDNAYMLDILPSYVSRSELTHLRLYGIDEFDDYLTPVQEILDACSRLRVLIMTQTFNIEVNDKDLDLDLDPDIVMACEKDLRLVMLGTDLCNTEDWLKGARGFYDSWTFAEQVVTARRKNYFKVDDLRRWHFTTFDLSDHLDDKGRVWYSEEQKQHVICPPASLTANNE